MESVYDLMPKKLAQRCISKGYFVAATTQNDGTYFVIDTTKEMLLDEKEHEKMFYGLTIKFNSIPEWIRC
jgi:protein associated with RNAse G/E